MTKKKIKHRLGEIELKDIVFVSDPIYFPGIWCQAAIEGIKSGKWIGFMYKKDTGKDWGTRVTDLWIAHEDYQDEFPTLLVKDVEIGVDSAKAGFFDSDYYLKHHKGELDRDWADRLYEATKTGEGDGAMIDGKCVVSTSGLGDGGYNLYASQNSEGEIIALRIKFI